MAPEQRARMCYYIAAVITVVLLLIIYRMWRDHAEKNGFASDQHGRVPDNPGNPQQYEYGHYLKARAALAAGLHGDRAYDYNRGHDHGAGGVSRIDFDQAHGYRANDGLGELMMNTHHWDQEGTYQHTADTWGLPTGYSGDSRVNYSGFSKEGMSVGAHWDTDGSYGHTASTLPAFGLSGYYEDVPTDSSS